MTTEQDILESLKRIEDILWSWHERLAVATVASLKASLDARAFQCCPVCQGRRDHAAGFYDGVTAASCLDREPCRTCGGDGVILAPVVVNATVEAVEKELQRVAPAPPDHERTPTQG